jgi:hypothetical protein
MGKEGEKWEYLRGGNLNPVKTSAVLSGPNLKALVWLNVRSAMT